MPSEDDLLEAVLALADEHQVLAFHSTDSRRDTGRGFPDLVLVGRHHLMFAELKGWGGVRSVHQTTWSYRLRATGARYALWNPPDLTAGRIEKAISEL